MNAWRRETHTVVSFRISVHFQEPDNRKTVIEEDQLIAQRAKKKKQEKVSVGRGKKPCSQNTLSC